MKKKKEKRPSRQWINGNDLSEEDEEHEETENRTRITRLQHHHTERRKKKSLNGIIRTVQMQCRLAENDSGRTMKSIFREFDRESNGKVTYDDFLDIFEHIQNRPENNIDKLNEDELRMLMSRFDIDLDETVNYYDFLRFVKMDSSNSSTNKKRKPELASVIRKIRHNLRRILRFRHSSSPEHGKRRRRRRGHNRGQKNDSANYLYDLFDTEGTGKVSISEMKRIFADLDVDLTRAELSLITKQFDRNHDSEIDIGDFLSLCGPRLNRNESHDRDEVIAVDLIRASLRKLARSEKTGALDIYHLFKELDRKGMQLISWSNFCSRVQRLTHLKLNHSDREELRDAMYMKSHDNFVTYERLSGFLSSDSGVGNRHHWSEGVLTQDRAKSLPISVPGSVGDYLETQASKLERKNYFKFLRWIGKFEDAIGLQQKRKSEPLQDSVVIQFGTRLHCTLKFHVR